MPDRSGHGTAARTRYEVAEAAGYGLTAEDLRRWDTFSPVEIYWAVKHGLSPATARRWAREGMRVGDTIRAVSLGMTPAQVRPWTAAGFLPGDAVEATESGISLATAAAWREAGFILPEAALLIHDGWTLEQATIARYRDVDRYRSRHTAEQTAQWSHDTQE